MQKTSAWRVWWTFQMEKLPLKTEQQWKLGTSDIISIRCYRKTRANFLANQINGSAVELSMSWIKEKMWKLQAPLAIPSGIK